jgi:hypothetical protein
MMITSVQGNGVTSARLADKAASAKGRLFNSLEGNGFTAWRVVVHLMDMRTHPITSGEQLLLTKEYKQRDQ